MPAVDLATLLAVYHGTGAAAYVLTRFVAAVRRESDAEDADLTGVYRPSRRQTRPEPVTGLMPVVVVPTGTAITAPGVGHTCDPLTCSLPPVVDETGAVLCGEVPVGPDFESFTDTWGADTIRRALIPPDDMAELIARVEAKRDTDADTTVDTTAIRAEVAA